MTWYIGPNPVASIRKPRYLSTDLNRWREVQDEARGRESDDARKYLEGLLTGEWWLLRSRIGGVAMTHW
jgi:hypothetical protein